MTPQLLRQYAIRQGSIAFLRVRNWAASWEWRRQVLLRQVNGIWLTAIAKAVSTFRNVRTQFYTSIASAVWTLDSGTGTLTQSGVYTAPGSAGSAVVRAHTSFWGTVNGAYYTKNANDTLTKNTASVDPNAQARSAFYVNNIGEYVTAIVPRTSFPYLFGLQDDAGVYIVAYFASLNPNFIAERHQASAISTNNAPTGGAWVINDVIKFEMIAGGLIQVKKNGATVFTTTGDFRSRNMRFVLDARGLSGEIITVPSMLATGYSEAIANITIT